eukprot:GHVT01097832.1.p1 GENE.GHVT01097832.1~~GHVT01097832.1.p1  ORF type:complete len:206 (+),score=49.59 GHVT01097832.1:297-914(+)
MASDKEPLSGGPGAGSSSDSDSEEEVPTLEEQGGETGEGSAASPSGRSKQSRNEKKARKAVLKHGMKEISDVISVTIKRPKTVMIVISSPDVFKSINGDTYVVFGEARMEDMNATAQSEAARRYLAGSGDGAGGLGVGGSGLSPLSGGAGARVEEVDDADESGMKASDIDLLMEQVVCTRAQAVRALREKNFDLVEAIMHLSAAH